MIAISFCAALVGAAGKRASPAVADGAVLTHVITTTLPPVLAGVVVSALLAAAMSTANALLISLAGCFSRDFYNKVLHPKAELDDLPRAVALRPAGRGGVPRGGGGGGPSRAGHPRHHHHLQLPLHGEHAGPAARRPAVAAAPPPRAPMRPWRWAARSASRAFAAGVPGPFHGLFNIDLALLVAFAVSAVVFVAVSLLTRRPV